MSSIVVYHGLLPSVTVEHGELMWENCEGGGKQVLATIVARPSCREAYVKLTTDESSIEGTADAIYDCDLAREVTIDQLANGPINVSSCFTSVMGVLTEAFEVKKGGDTFLVGSLEQWSFALSQVLPKVLPWDGPVRVSPAVIEAIVRELDGHLCSAYFKIPGIRPV